MQVSQSELNPSVSLSLVRHIRVQSKGVHTMNHSPSENQTNYNDNHNIMDHNIVVILTIDNNELR